MSDHCYLEIAFRNEDKEALSKHVGSDGDDFWSDEIDGGEGWRKVSVGEANYGWNDQLIKAAMDGIVFYGYAGEGGSYPSQLFVSFGGRLLTVYEISHWPAVRLNDSMEPMKQDMKEAKEYDMLLKLAVKHVEEGPDANSRSKPQEGVV
jgi:hypothetical protein